jgi:hypothetical protein
MKPSDSAGLHLFQDFARALVPLGSCARFGDLAACLARDLEARRAPGTFPIQGSPARTSSHARSAACSKSRAEGDPTTRRPKSSNPLFLIEAVREAEFNQMLISFWIPYAGLLYFRLQLFPIRAPRLGKKMRQKGLTHLVERKIRQ